LAGSRDKNLDPFVAEYPFPNSVRKSSEGSGCGAALLPTTNVWQDWRKSIERVQTEYVWIGIASLLGLWVGLLLGARGGARAAQTLLKPEVSTLRQDMASDREFLLRTLRRELANYMVRFDPDRFLRLYRKAREADIEIGKADKKVQEAERTVITKKYRVYQDFDLVGTREHVLYADALNMNSMEEVEEHFLNIVKFHALQRALDEDWRSGWSAAPATSDSDLEHLEKYVREIKDTKFWQRLKAALGEFLGYERNTDPDHLKGPIAYETSVFAVYWARHFAETRYGFHFKDTNEFGLYGVFYDDDSKKYEHFYRSDQNFEAEIDLDHLWIEEHI
jgi:hypothetical protein